MTTPAEYEHTQVGRLHWILVALGTITLAFTPLHSDATLTVVLSVCAAIFLLLAACFATLTIRSEGDLLIARFGPLPLFGKQVVIDSITDVRVGRSSWIDGIGIHWVPGRGWTYNIDGLACVILELDGKTLRLGTDDADGLAAFLRDRRRGSVSPASAASQRPSA